MHAGAVFPTATEAFALPTFLKQNADKYMVNAVRIDPSLQQKLVYELRMWGDKDIMQSIYWQIADVQLETDEHGRAFVPARFLDNRTFTHQLTTAEGLDVVDSDDGQGPVLASLRGSSRLQQSANALFT